MSDLEIMFIIWLIGFVCYLLYGKKDSAIRVGGVCSVLVFLAIFFWGQLNYLPMELAMVKLALRYNDWVFLALIPSAMVILESIKLITIGKRNKEDE